MTVDIKHAFVTTDVDSGNTSLVQPSNWNASHTFTMASGRLLGRATGGTGEWEEITPGTNLTLASGVISSSIYFGAPTTDYQAYTANGTWTKPSGVTFVFVRCVGAGGGGNGGLVSTSSLQVNALGGAGGSAGLITEYLFLATSLGSTAGIVIGAAGAGGSGQVYGGAAATAGSRGGFSSFNAGGTSGARLFATGGVGTDQNSQLQSSVTKAYSHGGYRLDASSAQYLASSGGAGNLTTHASNAPYGPAGGGAGAAGYSETYYTAGYGGVAFATRVSAPTTANQRGNTGSLGTAPGAVSSPYGNGAAGTAATVKGYGGSGAWGRNIANYPSSPYIGGTGGVGYLGGGGGGGGGVYMTATPPSGTITGGAGGAGGAGYVEVYSW